MLLCLGPGGAERVAARTANHWAEKGWDVSILTYVDDVECPPFYDLHPDIEYTPLGIFGASDTLLQGVWNNLARVRVLRKAIAERDPDVIVSHIDRENVLTYLATRGLGIPQVARLSQHPYREDENQLWEHLRRFTYRHVDRLVVQTQRGHSDLWRRARQRAVVIPNPVVEPPEPHGADTVDIPNPAIVTIGSLTEQKNHDLLLRAFATVVEAQPDWHLVLVGDGPLRSEIQRTARRLGIEDRVHLMGVIQEVYHVLRQAELFVLPSRYEGFPNALAEAMAVGLPVIATDCETGPRELIRDGVDGLLVPNNDVAALAAALSRLINAPGERARLSSRAPEVVERFSFDDVMATWDDLLIRVSGLGEQGAGLRVPASQSG